MSDSGLCTGYHRGLGLLIVLEDDLTGTGSVEGRGDICIARLVSGNGQGAVFDFVDGIKILADIVCLRTFGDDADALFRISVLAEGEGSLEPIVRFCAVELQGVAGNEQ